MSSASCWRIFIASALIDLAGLVEDGAERQGYLALAEKQLRSLASPAYRARLNQNGNFMLMYCVGNKGEGKEVDAPLVYADYYLLEALARWKAWRSRGTAGSVAGSSPAPKP